MFCRGPAVTACATKCAPPELVAEYREEYDYYPEKWEFRVGWIDTA
jgi:hypothetical protein